MNESLLRVQQILHEFEGNNPAIYYKNGSQGYIGIVKHFNLDEERLKIYFKWIIVKQKAIPLKLFCNSIATIKKPTFQSMAYTLEITHPEGTIFVTNLAEAKIKAMQEWNIYQQSNHH